MYPLPPTPDVPPRCSLPAYTPQLMHPLGCNCPITHTHTHTHTHTNTDPRVSQQAYPPHRFNVFLSLADFGSFCFKLRGWHPLYRKFWILEYCITSNHRSFCTNIYLQCYFVYWHLQQYSTQSSSLAKWDGLAGGSAWRGSVWRGLTPTIRISPPEIRSTGSGYASYWNAFLFGKIFAHVPFILCLKCIVNSNIVNLKFHCIDVILPLV